MKRLQLLLVAIKSVIDASDIDEAEDRVIAGPSKKDKTVSQKERELVAYHEAGHTIVGLVLSNARVVHKVTMYHAAVQAVI